MNKISTLLFCLTLIGSLSFGQKDKTKSERINFLSLPKTIQSPEVNTYRVEVKNFGRLHDLDLNAKEMAYAVNLNAYARVDKGEPEMRVIITIPSFGKVAATQSSNTKDDGTTTYNYAYTCDPRMSYEIITNGESIKSGKLVFKMSGKNSKFSWTGSFATTSSESRAKYNKTGRADLKKKLKAYIQDQFDRTVTQMKKDVDYYPVSSGQPVFYFKTTKKADFTDYEKAADDLIAAMSSIQSTSNRDAFKGAAASSVKFWQDKMAGLNPQAKGEDNLYLHCALNLAASYYWMDELAEAEGYLNKANTVKGRSVVKSGLERNIASRRNALQICEVNGIDPYKGITPATMEELDEIRLEAEAQEIAREAEIAARIERERLKLEPVIEEVSGYIIDRNDQRVEGSFKLYKKNTHEREGKVYFIRSGSTAEDEISVSFMKSGEFAGTKYVEVMFGDAIGGRDKELMKVLYESPKISVLFYKYKSTDGKQTFTNTYFIRPGEERATNTTNATFLVAYKKKMANYFEGCPALVSKIEAGEYPDSKNMRIAIATDYTSLCN